MKVLHLLATNSFSGAENVVCQIIKMFETDKNFEMFYCSPNGPINESLQSKGIKYLPIERLTTKAVKQIVKEIKPDIIHAHDVRASIIASKMDKHIEVISHIHGNHDKMRKITAKSILYEATVKRFKKIFWVSETALKDYRFYSKVKSKSEILVNVINRDEIINRATQAINAEEADIVYLGRFSDEKNPKRVYDIMKNIINKDKDIKGVFIGDGILKEDIQQNIINDNMQNNIQIKGFLKNPMPILKNAKILLMASKYEGTPMCVLEAMALGIPIVSTPTDGVKSLIKNGVTGYLSNNDNELVENGYGIITDNEYRKKLSKNIIEEFNKRNNIEEYKEKLKSAYFERK